jgi:hypothetical protein
MSKRIDPEVAKTIMLRAGLLPLEEYKNANSNWLCKCLNCNEEVVSRYNRVQQGSGCPKCTLRAAGIKSRLDEDTAIKRLLEYNLTPLEPYVRSDLKWKCKCITCGAVVFPKLKNLQRGDGGCLNCGIRKAGEKNRLSEKEAIGIANELGFIPIEPYENALTKWKMRHTVCNAIVNPKLNSLRNSAGETVGCAVCSGHQVEIGFNDLGTTHPEIAKEADGWNPSTVTAGSSKMKKRWRCSAAGHVWNTSVAQRTDGHGCPTCSQHGYDPNKDGYFYFLQHESWDMFQIGITNDPKSRLASHARLGWTLRDIRGPMDGLLARDWETDSLRYLRRMGVRMGPEEFAGKFDGYSESWRSQDLQINSISQLLNAVRNSDY